MKTYIFSFEYNAAKAGERINRQMQVVVIVANSFNRAISVAHENKMEIDKSNLVKVLTNEDFWKKD